VTDLDVLLPIRTARADWLTQTLVSLGEQTGVEIRLVAVIHPHDAALRSVVTAVHPNAVLVTAPPEGNLSDALNAGLKQCLAPFTARIDADDIAEPERFQRQLEALQGDGECLAIGSGATLIDHQGHVIGQRRMPASPKRTLQLMRWKSAVMHPTVTFRTDAVRSLGGYSAAATNVEDYELWLRLLQWGTIRSLPEPLLRYRIHGGQVTQTRSISSVASDAVLESRIALARFRAESILMARFRHALWRVKQQQRRICR
jgi:glycosyltransferase involved in cell wall biosynthesis